MTAPAAAVARRLTDYTVLAHDPAVPAASATFWEDSRAAYERVDQATADLLAGGSAADRSYSLLRSSPQSIDAYRAASRDLRTVLDQDASACQLMADLVREADEEIWIDYHLGPAYRPSAESPPSASDLLGGRRPRPAAARSADGDVLVVIPFRDRIGGSRIRNIVACLLALQDQSPDAGSVTVTVVEADEQPRWRDLIQPLASRYVFLSHPGDFNKSWVINVGVVRAPVTPALVCVLDADIIVDRHFLVRNRQRFAAGGRVAHLPYRRMYCLDATSTNAAMRTRCQEGRPDVPLDQVRAYVLREPPGACLWVTADAFHRIGGFDERFVGWGGEDNDVVARLALAGDVRRFDDPLLHLDHERPAMRRDGRPLNPPEQPWPWSSEADYGDPIAPATTRPTGTSFPADGHAQEPPC
jgi:N-terminal domain of galactosyltransferase